MAQGPMTMAETNFPPLGDESFDDLPRTFRREKEARAKEARDRAAQERAAAPTLSTKPDSFGGDSLRPDIQRQAPASLAPQPRVQTDTDYAPELADMPYPASVRRIDVPFMHLVKFFLKAVIAAIPALILLTVILWLFGSALQAFFPNLVKLKILIGFQG